MTDIRAGAGQMQGEPETSCARKQGSAQGMMRHVKRIEKPA